VSIGMYSKRGLGFSRGKCEFHGDVGVLIGTNMRKLALVVLLTAVSSVARADIIFTNLTSAYQPASGLSVVSGGTDFSLAYSFVVTGNSYQLTQIDFTTFFSQVCEICTNEISATIYSDNSGLPSGTPGTLPIGGMGQVDPTGQIYTTGVLTGVIGTEVMQPVTNGPVLNVGQTYWLSLDGATDASVGWNYAGPDTTGVIGAASYYNGSAWVSYGSNLQGAFEIDGTIVAPEPVSTALFMSGLAALIVLRRKQKLS